MVAYKYKLSLVDMDSLCEKQNMMAAGCALLLNCCYWNRSLEEWYGEVMAIDLWLSWRDESYFIYLIS